MSVVLAVGYSRPNAARQAARPGALLATSRGRSASTASSRFRRPPSPPSGHRQPPSGSARPVRARGRVGTPQASRARWTIAAGVVAEPVASEPGAARSRLSLALDHESMSVCVARGRSAAAAGARGRSLARERGRRGARRQGRRKARGRAEGRPRSAVPDFGAGRPLTLGERKPGRDGERSRPPRAGARAIRTRTSSGSCSEPDAARGRRVRLCARRPLVPEIAREVMRAARWTVRDACGRDREEPAHAARSGAAARAALTARTGGDRAVERASRGAARACERRPALAMGRRAATDGDRQRRSASGLALDDPASASARSFGSVCALDLRGTCFSFGVTSMSSSVLRPRLKFLMALPMPSPICGRRLAPKTSNDRRTTRARPFRCSARLPPAGCSRRCPSRPRKERPGRRSRAASVTAGDAPRENTR